MISVLFWGWVSAQNLSGVVNSYYAVSNVNNNEATLTVDNAAGISIGDTLLFIQMKGALIDASNSDSYGDIVHYGGAGNYELVEVCDIQGNNVILKTRLEKTYFNSVAQLVSIPSASNQTITSTVTCSAWNGSKGGVVVIKAANTIALNADIDVSEKGFRGGTHFYANTNCNFVTDFGDYEYDLASNLGAIKGEGIAEYSTMNCGRGALANGGGGGNDHNSGGAGGGNVTNGGNGGDNDDPGTFRCKGYYPGKGGKALDFSEGKIFLGGGGGGGHSNSAPTPYNAGNGGGIIILIAEEIVGNGGRLMANGGDGEDGIGDGGAGGGAGGSILLVSNTFSGSIDVLAEGGDGGNGDGAVSVTSVNTDRCFGPGGGGSGGFLWLSASGSSVNLLPNLSGGTNGVVSGTTHAPCMGLAQGAEGGETGLVAFDAEMPMSRKINSFCENNPQLDIGNDTVLCVGQSVTYTSNISGSYDWNTGATSSSITVSASGTYLLEVDDGIYLYCDSATVSSDAPPLLDIGDVFYLCEMQAISLAAPSGYATYLWSTGETSPSISVNTTGEYWVEVGGQYCSSSDTVQVLNETFVEPFEEDKIELCDAEGLSLNAGYAGGSYVWSTGANSQIITVNEPGSVYVEIISANGCEFKDEVEIIPCTSVPVPNTITPNGDGVNDTWVIRQIYAFPKHHVTIVDRSGRVVFDTDGYNNDWDGRGLPATVYYYSITLDQDFEPLKGTITIIRE